MFAIISYFEILQHNWSKCFSDLLIIHTHICKILVGDFFHNFYYFCLIFVYYNLGGISLFSSPMSKFSFLFLLSFLVFSLQQFLSVNTFLDCSIQLCSRISTSKETVGRYKNLFVSKDSKSDGRECQLFVDTAVYSRNRCFRLPLSSKAGKTSALLPSGRFKCKDMVWSFLDFNVKYEDLSLFWSILMF